ncbi:hypothetical protein GQ457_12G017990 [Hibiscus cannabinus]
MTLALTISMTFQTPLSSIICLAQPVRSAQFREPVITGSSTVAERSRYPLDRSDLLFQVCILPTPLSSIICLAQPVRSAQFRSSTVAERSRYPLDRSDLLFQMSGSQRTQSSQSSTPCNLNDPISNQPVQKRQQPRAPCWKHLSIFVTEDGVNRARCFHCDTTYSMDTRGSTTKLE